jgi:hypothetical protein
MKKKRPKNHKNRATALVCRLASTQSRALSSASLESKIPTDKEKIPA